MNDFASIIFLLLVLMSVVYKYIELEWSDEFKDHIGECMMINGEQLKILEVNPIDGVLLSNNTFVKPLYDSYFTICDCE